MYEFQGNGLGPVAKQLVDSRLFYMITAILSLGSNSGQRKKYIEAMERELSSMFQSPLMRSRLMETEPLEVDGAQMWYINRIVGGVYDSSAHDLLYKCLKIEIDLGRDRPYNHAPRTADIDILLFGDSVINTTDLQIPHAALCERRFCMEGLNDIAPRLIIPEKGVTVNEYLARLPEHVKNQKINFLS